MITSPTKRWPKCAERGLLILDLKARLFQRGKLYTLISRRMQLLLCRVSILDSNMLVTLNLIQTKLESAKIAANATVEPVQTGYVHVVVITMEIYAKIVLILVDDRFVGIYAKGKARSGL